MSGEVVGQAVNAVLAPPQAERFAAVADVDLNRLVLNVTGWNKLVLLDFDRVFLFPRSAIGVEWFERELAAYRALAKTQLGIVPRLLGCWEDPEIYPFPFAAVTRLPGEVPAEPEVLIEQLGRAIACWHELEPPALAGARPPRHHDAAHHRWLRRALDPATSAEAAAEAAGRPGPPRRRAPPAPPTPLIIAGCAGLWTRQRAPRRPLRPRIAWAGPDASRRGRTCWPASPSSRRCWSTATSTKTSCLLTATG